MENFTLKSSLTKEEIENNFKDFDLFSELMTALNEALEHEKNTNG